MVPLDRSGAAESLLLHMEHLINLIRRMSGDAFLTKVMARAGLPFPWDRAKAGHVTMDDEAELIRLTAELSGDTTYPTRLGLNYSNVTSVPGYVARNCRTLRTAIQRSKRYTAFSGAALHYDLRETADVATLWVRAVDPATDRNLLHREFGVFAVLSIMRFIANRSFQPLEVTFRHRRSTGAESIRRAACCPVSWSGSEDSIRMQPSTLDLAIPTYDPRLRDILVQHGETLLERTKRSGGGFRARVEHLVLDGFADGAPNADDVASKLGMSRRTLTRRLSEDGLTFRQVLDEVRLDVAHSYLHDTALSLAEISFQLGYADQAAFTTAYKRWTGKTPSVDRGVRHL